MTEELDGTASTAPIQGKTRLRKPELASPEVQLLGEISTKLDRVIAVLAVQGKEKEKQIDILSSAGCDSNFIGVVVGMTGASVRKFQSRQRGKTSTTARDGEAVEPNLNSGAE